MFYLITFAVLFTTMLLVAKSNTPLCVAEARLDRFVATDYFTRQAAYFNRNMKD